MGQLYKRYGNQHIKNLGLLWQINGTEKATWDSVIGAACKHVDSVVTEEEFCYVTHMKKASVIWMVEHSLFTDVWHIANYFILYTVECILSSLM